MFESKIKLRIASDKWREIKEEFSEDEDEQIVNNLIATYFENKTLKKDILNLKNKIESNKRFQEKQGKKISKLEKKYNKAMLKQKTFKKKFQDIAAENDELKSHPRIEEKIEYKENTTALNALRRKRDELKKKNHRLLLNIEQLENKNNELQEKLDEKEKNIQDLQKKNYALLLEISHPNTEPEVKIIDSKMYYQYKADPEDFRRKLGLNSNFIVKELSHKIT